VVYAQSEAIPIAATPVTRPVQGWKIRLGTRVDGVQKGRRLLIIGPRPKVKVADGVHLTLKTDAGSVGLAPRQILTVVGPFTDEGTHRSWHLQTQDGHEGTVTTNLRPAELIPVPSAASDEVFVERVGKEGWAVASDSGLTVAVDTVLDDELRRERRVLDLIHHVNAMRREAGLELTDRIRVWIPDEDLLAYEDRIKEDTLAVSVEPGELRIEKA